MSTQQAHAYTAETLWQRGNQPFLDKRYSRAHLLRFDGGIEVPGSASPLNVPLPCSVAEAVDPEEAFISAISACHMLWFLSVACKRGFVVDAYHDQARGEMHRNARGKLAITQVMLQPAVRFVGERQPSSEELNAMHHEAHDECFIANSVLSEVVVVPRQVN